MRPTRPLLALVLALGLACPPQGAVGAQSVVDEGSFRVRIDGRDAGSESFTIRRAGIGNDATIVAYGVVELQGDGGARELRPMLLALPPDGAASGYELKVSGSEATELTLNLAGTRYLARIRSKVGEEEREFLARPGTRVVDRDVAHQYYFLRTVREGEVAPVIEPASRRQLRLRVDAVSDDRLLIGGTAVPARRVSLGTGEDGRTVWFDRQGRVLRVEVPARGYVAERDDLVG